MRAALLVDSSNLFYCIGKRWPERRLDYDKWVEAIKAEVEIVASFAYGAQINDQAKGFITCLRHLDFIVRYISVDGSEEKDAIKQQLKQHNWNVQIAIDALNVLGNVDIVILGSTDKNLAPLISHIIDKGKKCYIYACGIPQMFKELGVKAIEIKDDLLIEIKPDENGEESE